MEIMFDNKVVVITGGSKGIGRGLVKSFSNAKAKVYFTYLKDTESAENVIKECECESNNKPIGFKVDGRSKSEVKEFIDHIWKENQTIDVLINNAGYIPRGLFLNTTETVWNNTMESNVNSIYHYCSSVLKYMMLQKNGVIINMSSVSGYYPGKGQGAYGASKGAIESLTKVLALEYGLYNIRVNTIAPGLVETEVAKTITPQIKENILSRTPLGRFASIDDVSNAALFLASDKANYITGSQILITGGRHLG